MVLREFKRKKDWKGLEKYLDQEAKKREKKDAQEISEHLNSLDDVTRKKLLARVNELTNTKGDSDSDKAA